jgi:hypothetical protein
MVSSKSLLREDPLEMTGMNNALPTPNIAIP